MDINLIGVNELSEALGVPRSWIYARTRLKGTNAIPCLRVGKYCKFNLDAVMKWLERQNKDN